MYLEREKIHGTKEGQGIRLTTPPSSKEVGNSPAPTVESSQEDKAIQL